MNTDEAAARERELWRRSWLADSPVGARDFCAASRVVGMQDEGAPPARMDCFHGSAGTEELRAYGWELTDVRTNIHKHSPGYEVEVVNAVAVKTRCIGPAVPLAERPKGLPGCAEASQGKRVGLFWLPPREPDSSASAE